MLPGICSGMVLMLYGHVYYVILHVVFSIYRFWPKVNKDDLTYPHDSLRISHFFRHNKFQSICTRHLLCNFFFYFVKRQRLGKCVKFFRIYSVKPAPHYVIQRAPITKFAAGFLHGVSHIMTSSLCSGMFHCVLPILNTIALFYIKSQYKTMAQNIQGVTQFSGQLFLAMSVCRVSFLMLDAGELDEYLPIASVLNSAVT